MSGSKPYILIIEDDIEIRSSLLDVLDDEGIEAKAVTNGQEALIFLRNGSPKPALILLDIMMPVMNGYEFREEQLRDGELSQIPTAILSADGHVEQKAARVGLSDYLKKPVDLDCLFDLVDKFIRGQAD